MVLAGTIPNCISYDPTFSYEMAVIIQDGLRRMYVEQQNVYLLHHGDERKLSPSRHAGRVPSRALSRGCICPAP